MVTATIIAGVTPASCSHQRGQQLQEARGLGSGVGVEQFLGLIHRQHQGGGGLLGGHIQQPGAGGLAGLLQPAPQPLDMLGVGRRS